MKPPHTALVIAILAIICFKPDESLCQVASSKPNIVFIMVDDGRYDETRNTGAPSWFELPHIERIANEGVNFSRAYTTVAMCGPSRATVYTGLYPHQHKVENNGQDFADSLPTIQDILNDNGYYTGFIGKYGQGFHAPNEFDYFVNMQDDVYKNTFYNVNGSVTYIPGHCTNVLGDFVNDFLDSTLIHSDQPFALFFFPLAPHPPNTPQHAYMTIYEGLPLNYPIATEPFEWLYPEYYYEGTSLWVKDSNATVNFMRDRLACIRGLDDVVEDIFQHLDTHGITDSTFMLYTSDNGYLMGEHKMRAKVFAMEESIRVPFFVRFPEWFPDSAEIENELIELIDIPVTFLDLIDVPNTFGFFGYSLRDLFEPDTLRHYVRYAFGGDDDGPGYGFEVPDIRGVRSFDHLFTWADCNCYEEELYDFTTDPLQEVNQILNVDYLPLIAFYRNILDSLLIATGDTIFLETRDCFLVDAYEIEDGIDQDCDGFIDEGFTLSQYFIDGDGDGYGSIDSSIISLYPILGFVLDSTDCNDDNAMINPGAIDYCDLIDNNCNGIVDEYVVIPEIYPSDTVYFCDGLSAFLWATPELEGFSPKWYKDGVEIEGSNFYFHYAYSSGTYTVKFKAPAGCITESNPVVVIERANPTPKVKNNSLTNDLSINFPVNLSTKKITGYSYQWYYNDIIIWGATTHKFSAGLPGFHKCKVTDTYGCSGFTKNFKVIQTLRFANEDVYVENAALNLFPNPASENVTLEFTSDTEYFGEAKIQLMNIIGQPVFSWDIIVLSGNMHEVLQLDNSITPGFYLIECIIGSQKWIKPLVIE